MLKETVSPPAGVEGESDALACKRGTELLRESEVEVSAAAFSREEFHVHILPAPLRLGVVVHVLDTFGGDKSEFVY